MGLKDTEFAHTNVSWACTSGLATINALGFLSAADCGLRFELRLRCLPALVGFWAGFEAVVIGERVPWAAVRFADTSDFAAKMHF